MKGIILAGGTGSRLLPLTKMISKQLLPVYDKPLIYYPISTLMLSGIREILVITTPEQLPSFKLALGSGAQWGIKFEYEVQPFPGGIAQGVVIGSEFIGKSNFALILGDNIFYGTGLGRALSRFSTLKGAHIFAHRVADPERFGVIEFDSNGAIISLQEKPFEPKSNFAITGLYFFDSRAAALVGKLKPSQRNELEILDLLQEYLNLGELDSTILPFGTAWLDTGTFQSLHDASTFVRLVEERQGISIGNPLVFLR